ncbi:MAG TPA: GMC family oxidoreductase [Steroidobacteraceae bacterium]|nr:GMC family oxidoreductase [Steroidobacteraceae bacterium]
MSGRQYKDGEVVDFVVVGSGAAGGVIARELSQAGFDVVVMEQGPRLGPADFEHDELKYWYLNGIMNTPEQSPQTFRKLPTEKAERVRDFNAAWYARIVGGSSNHFTANFWRLRPVDFKERSLLGDIPGTGFADWPISYEELEPYYTKVEWEVGVSGLAGACPTDPPRSKPYPMPPLPVKSSGVLFERGARKLGLHPYPAPMAITSVPYRGRPPCQHCGFCIGYGCEYMAKSSSLYTMIPEAEATGRCEVRAESYVFRIDTDARGRATGVAYFDRGRRERFQKAKAVVVSANGAETPRLLLNSANAKFPDGLANSSGLVGKYLMFNQGAIAGGVFEHELNEHKSVQVTRILHDFYDADPKRGFYGGGGIDGRINPVPLGFPLFGLPAEMAWGAPLKRALRDMPRTMFTNSHTTSLALERNSISIDPELKDAWGVPSIRMTYKDHPDDLAIASWLNDRGHAILEAAGALRTWKMPVVEWINSPHLLGTCRMGDDPARSVVDRYHRSHDIPNLFVCDGSSMVTSGRGQPTMTIQALAFRAGDHIARFARRGEI